MKNIIASCFVLMQIMSLNAQNSKSDSLNKPERITISIPNDSNKIFTIVQVKPKFPGDIDKYLSEQINYPDKARDSNIQGTVYVSFVVERDGRVSNATILRGVNNYLNDEAIRVISKMPKWTPGTQNGHTVRVQYMVPIRFVIRNDEQNSSPKFPYDLSEWISKQAEYPEEAAKRKLEGTVYVRFNIEKDGSVSKITTVKGIKDGIVLDKEAERIISVMPKWTPAYEDNKPVSTELIVKVAFTLKGDSIARSIPVKIDSNLTEKPSYGEDLDDWIHANFIYPHGGKRQDHIGNVKVSYIIEKDGSVSHVKIVRSEINYLPLENEALRLVYLMHNWIPGHENGVPVRTQMYYTFRFTVK